VEKEFGLDVYGRMLKRRLDAEMESKDNVEKGAPRIARERR
jgi:hypothetical protein